MFVEPLRRQPRLGAFCFAHRSSRIASQACARTDKTADRTPRTLAAHARARRGHPKGGVPGESPSVARYARHVTDYMRPDVQPLVFRDAAGGVIHYGDRWGGDSPPDDSYSVTSNLERFAPLHVVAEALIRYLSATYDVEISEDRAFAADLMHERRDVLRAVRLRPRERDAATLTFVFTSFPSVIIHAGLLHDFLYPVCGCDACDEAWENQADEMEWQVDAVVTGTYREYLRPGPWVGMSLESADGNRKTGAESSATDPPSERVVESVGRLDALAGPWLPWPIANTLLLRDPLDG